MSRHLIIRCDAPGCVQQTETRAPDHEPGVIGVPSGWLTLSRAGANDQHYCSETCLRASPPPASPPPPPVKRR